MQDKVKTKEQLLKELEELRQRITELEQSEVERKQTEEKLRESESRFNGNVLHLGQYAGIHHAWFDDAEFRRV